MSRIKSTTPSPTNTADEGKFKMTLFEQETCSWYNREDKLGYISTYDKSLIKTLDEYCVKYPKDYQFLRDIIIDKTVCGKEYTCLKKYIGFKKPSSRKLTEEQRLAAGQRLQNNRNKTIK